MVLSWLRALWKGPKTKPDLSAKHKNLVEPGYESTESSPPCRPQITASPLGASASGSSGSTLVDPSQVDEERARLSKHPNARGRKPPKSPNYNASRKHARNSLGKNVAPTIKHAVIITKEISGMFPPLKAVAGGLLEFMNIYEKYLQNNDSIIDTARRVNDILEHFDDQDLEMLGPEELNRVTRKFHEIQNRLDELVTKGGYSKAVQAHNIELIINRTRSDVEGAITMYQTSLHKAIYKRLDNLGYSSQNRYLRDLLEAKNMDPMTMGIIPCLPNTRMEVLEEICGWATKPDHAKRVFWLKGHAGSGKSAIAMRFCLGVDGRDYRIGASFFCSRDNTERRNVHNIFPSIALQLSARFVHYRNALFNTVEHRNVHFISSLNDQFNFLIVEPLQQSRLETIIIIDALDECLKEDEVSAFVTLLASQIKCIPLVKFFITARPEDHIRLAFGDFQRDIDDTSYILELDHHDPDTLEPDHQNINRDIRTFLSTRLHDISRSHRSDVEDLLEEWPSEEHLKVLVRKSSQLFIFAATIITFIEDKNYKPREQLEKLVDSDLQTTNYIVGSTGKLDTLYRHILLQLGHDYSSPDLLGRFRLVVGYIVVSFQALSQNMLQRICQRIGKDAVNSVIERLHSVMNIQRDQSKPIYLYHQSFRDYITDIHRCRDRRFYISIPTYHRSMAISCLQLIKSSLTRRSIYDSETNPKYRYAANSAIGMKDRERAIGKHLEYACRFWTRHLVESFIAGDGMTRKHKVSESERSELQRLVTDFIRFRQVFWLEMLSVINDLDNASEYLQQLYECLNNVFGIETPDLLTLVMDAQRMVSDFFPCIKEFANHIYHSALPLSPRSVLLRTMVLREWPLTGEVDVMQGTGEFWKAKPQILEHCVGEAPRITYSDDGSMLIIVGETRADLFSVKSGKPLGTFKIPDANPTAFSFSTNTRRYPRLVSSWTNGSIIVWDTNTCGYTSRFDELAYSVRHVSFSPDGKWFAAVDDEKNVFIWDTMSGQLDYKFHSASYRPHIIAWWLLKGSTFVTYDGSLIEYWDALRKQRSNVLQVDIFEGRIPEEWDVELHSNRVQLIIRRSSTVKVYDLANMKLATIIEHPDFVGSQPLTISNDIEYAALREDDHVKVYSISSGNATLISSLPPFGNISSMAFSPDGSQLAFSSEKNVHIWEVRNLPQLSVDGERSIHSSVVTLSGDGLFFAAGFSDGTVTVTDLKSGTVDSFEVKDNFDRITPPTALSFSPKTKYLSIVLEKQKRAATFDGVSIYIWALEHKELRHMSTPGESSIKDVSFVDDRVVLGFAEDRIEAWDAHTGAHLQTVLCDISLKLDTRTWIEPKASEFILHRRSLVGETRRAKVEVMDDQIILQKYDKKDNRTSNLVCASSYPVIGGEWIVNQHGQRILWVPPEWRISATQVGSEDVSDDESIWKHEERVWGRWASRKLALLGPRGQVLAVDFSDVKVDVPSAEEVVEVLQYKQSTELLGLRRNLFLRGPSERKAI